MIHAEAADLEAELVQLGRNTADRCEATFYALVAARTADPALVAAAERGRREALEQGSSRAESVEGIHVVVATEQTVIARVRDDRGIWDVTHGNRTGWSCSCIEAGTCCHVLAVRQVTAGAVAR